MVSSSVHLVLNLGADLWGTFQIASRSELLSRLSLVDVLAADLVTFLRLLTHGRCCRSLCPCRSRVIFRSKGEARGLPVSPAAARKAWPCAGAPCLCPCRSDANGAPGRLPGARTEARSVPVPSPASLTLAEVLGATCLTACSGLCGGCFPGPHSSRVLDCGFPSRRPAEDLGGFRAQPRPGVEQPVRDR